MASWTLWNDFTKACKCHFPVQLELWYPISNIYPIPPCSWTYSLVISVPDPCICNWNLKWHFQALVGFPSYICTYSFSGNLAQIWLPHLSALQMTVMTGYPPLLLHNHQYTRQRLKTTGNHWMLHPRLQYVRHVGRSLKTHWFLVLPAVSTHERIYRKVLLWKLFYMKSFQTRLVSRLCGKWWPVEERGQLWMVQVEVESTLLRRMWTKDMHLYAELFKQKVLAHFWCMLCCIRKTPNPGTLGMSAQNDRFWMAVNCLR